MTAVMGQQDKTKQLNFLKSQKKENFILQKCFTKNVEVF